MLRNRHVTRFGHPFSRPGARYHVSDIEGLEQAALDISLARIAAQGHVTSQLETVQLLADTHQARLSYESMIRALGIPKAIDALLSATTKREVERIAEASIITENELFLLVHNHSQKGLTHRSRFPEFVPDHLQITDTDRKEMHSSVFGRISRKISSLFTFRKLVHVHMFERDTQWQCMFFSYEDIDEPGANHWKHGPHIHYVSHLWPHLDPQQVWEGFDKRKGRVSAGLHIRFRPFEFTNGSWDPGMRSGLTADVLFPMDPPQLRGQDPTPPAQLMTRGAWTADIFVPVDR
ncbi:MAG: hypothetical protein A2Z14_15305 [Chloroflexi bacterium RBG_16_48_8]|nr:MAG: hypothetical protein A2Z14_15305 [Chloroflexi bacterium RBG_16_48_8]